MAALLLLAVLGCLGLAYLYPEVWVAGMLLIVVPYEVYHHWSGRGG